LDRDVDGDGPADDVTLRAVSEVDDWRGPKAMVCGAADRDVRIASTPARRATRAGGEDGGDIAILTGTNGSVEVTPW
jgi:hypothetical protein